MYGPPQAERVAAPPEGTAASCTISGCARTQQHSVVHGLRTHCVAAKCATAVFCRSMALWPLARAAAATQCARRSRQLQPPAASPAASVGCGARTAQRVLPCRQRAVAAAVAFCCHLLSLRLSDAWGSSGAAAGPREAGRGRYAAAVGCAAARAAPRTTAARARRAALWRFYGGGRFLGVSLWSAGRSRCHQPAPGRARLGQQFGA